MSTPARPPDLARTLRGTRAQVVEQQRTSRAKPVTRNLRDHEDVADVGPDPGDTLVYNRTKGLWEPQGLAAVPVAFRVNSYTLVLEDAGVMQDMNKATALTLTVPTNAAVPFPIGTVIPWRQSGAGVLTLAPVSGTVTIQAPLGLISAFRWAEGALSKRGTNEWVASGLLEF